MTKSRRVAICAVSAALSTAFVMLAAYIELLSYFGIMMASFCMLLPLYKKTVTGAFLTFTATSILSLLFVSFNIAVILPYIAFFGYHPILNYIWKKIKLNTVISVVLNLILFNGAFYLIFLFAKLFITGDFLNSLPYYWLAILASAVFISYDIVMKYAQGKADKILERLKI